MQSLNHLPTHDQIADLVRNKLVKKLHLELGEFDFGDAPEGIKWHGLEYKIMTHNGIKFYGQVRTGTDVSEGRVVSLGRDGSLSIGWWKDDTPCGFGRIIYPDGRAYYQGEWLDGMQNGIGYEVTSKGSTYLGEFENGWKQGLGQRINSKGERRFGLWKEDHLIEP